MQKHDLTGLPDMNPWLITAVRRYDATTSGLPITDMASRDTIKMRIARAIAIGIDNTQPLTPAQRLGVEDIVYSALIESHLHLLADHFDVDYGVRPYCNTNAPGDPVGVSICPHSGCYASHGCDDLRCGGDAA